MTRLFVLGAGATKALNPSAPMNRELLRHIVQLDPEELICRDAIHTFIKEVYNIHSLHEADEVLERILPPIEDVLSLLDYCKLENRPLSEDYDVAAIHKLSIDMIFGICHALLEATKQDSANVCLQAFHNFISGINSANDTHIVSLNYDLIIDKALLDIADAAPHASMPMINYGFSPHTLVDLVLHRNKVSIDPSKAPVPYAANTDICIYKLHGSLNWLYCPECQQMDIVNVRNLETLYPFSGCSDEFGNCGMVCASCGQHYRPYIISPTFLKSYDDENLKAVWQRAEAKIAQAEEIVFIGYSLSDADIVLRSMFKRAVAGGKKLRRVRVVDAQKTGGQIWNDEDAANYYQLGSLDYKDTHIRYVRLFGDDKAKVTVDYDPTGFMRYVKSGCLTAKQRNNWE